MSKCQGCGKEIFPNQAIVDVPNFGFMHPACEKQRCVKKNTSAETVNHPSHYNQGSLEVIDAIEGLGLGFNAGNVVKYVARHEAKNGLEDLKKAKWYLKRMISSYEQLS